MLWSGKLFIVGVTVEANAMVRIDADSGNWQLDKRWSDKRRSACENLKINEPFFEDYFFWSTNTQQNKLSLFLDTGQKKIKKRKVEEIYFACTANKNVLRSGMFLFCVFNLWKNLSVLVWYVRTPLYKQAVTQSCGNKGSSWSLRFTVILMYYI